MNYNNVINGTLVATKQRDMRPQDQRKNKELNIKKAFPVAGLSHQVLL